MSEPILETIGLTKDFRRRRAVDDLSLRVTEGSVYGFLGSNGAGKSTTIRMLTGLIRPNSGTARLLGRDVRTDRVRALREVGALVEMPAFYKYMSGRENLRILSRLSGGCDGKRLDHVLDTVGLLDRADDKVKTYSHGMVQRLGIGQALLPNPKLVILDEPTSGLDPQGMKDVRELIIRLAKEENITVFLSSHLLHEVEQVCDRVGVVNRGRLIAEGEVRELLRHEVELVELTVSDENRAAKILSELDWVELLPTNGLGKIAVRAEADRIREINRTLVESGVDVSGIVPRSMNLEELFLKLIEEGEDD